MAKELSYKKSTTVILKAVGMFDFSNGTIGVEGENQKILDLLAGFDGYDIEISAKIKTDEELDIPSLSE